MNSSNSTMDGGTGREALGSRLRKAREDRGMTLAMAAAALKVPANVIDALEQENFTAIGAPIFVRGHLRSYVRLLGMADAVWENAVAKWSAPEPELRSASHVSHARFLADRYAMRAVYVLLTLSIIVPALWVATQHAPVELRSAVRSLDAPVPLTGVASDGSSLPLASNGPATTASLIAQEPAAAQTPANPTRESTSVDDVAVMASMTPFYQPAAAAAELPQPSAGDLVFVFSADSWLEVVARDGRRMAYGMARAGETRTFAVGQIDRVAIGNVAAVTVSRDGQNISLEAHRRANVARFAVSSDGEIQSSGG